MGLFGLAYSILSLIKVVFSWIQWRPMMKLAFALAPIPAYLPQYLALRNENAKIGSADEDKNHNHNNNRDNSSPIPAAIRHHNNLDNTGAAVFREHHGLSSNTVTMRRQTSFGDILVQQNTTNTQSITSACPSSPLIAGIKNSTSLEHHDILDHTTMTTTASSSAATGTANNKGGFSSISIFLLLYSHSLRLLYFSIAILLIPFLHQDEHHDNITTSTTKTAAGVGATTKTIPNTGPINARLDDETVELHKIPIHYDLILQSITMIFVQLLLLKALIQKRYQQLRKVRKRTSSEVTLLSDNNSNNNSNKDHHYNQLIIRNHKPFQWILYTKRKQYWKWDHLRYYIEFIGLLTIITFLTILCHEHVHTTATNPTSTTSSQNANNNGHAPSFRIQTLLANTILTVRNLSIILESCLALPQVLLNHQRKDTNGLSLLMVIGWVVGDFLKLIYFVMGRNDVVTTTATTTANTATMNHQHHAVGGGDMTSSTIVFIYGSIFALFIDNTVILQMLIWYPTKQVQDMKNYLDRKRRLIGKQIVNQEFKVNGAMRSMGMNGSGVVGSGGVV